MPVVTTKRLSPIACHHHHVAGQAAGCRPWMTSRSPLEVVEQRAGHHGSRGRAGRRSRARLRRLHEHVLDQRHQHVAQAFVARPVRHCGNHFRQ
jgi:hypothetical protein